MNEERKTQLFEALDHLLPVLISEYQPDKIVLFGSLARGEVKRWSDLDLLIIKDTTRPFVQRLKEVALLCRASVGIDFLVYTPEEVAQMRAVRHPFLEEILHTGQTLYERKPVSTMA